MIGLKVRWGIDAIEFEVSDNRIGISGDDQTRIFQSFHRGSNVENVAGIGLGLVIVKMAVDVFGGTIQMQSILGKGTQFHVTLPQTENAEGKVT